MDLPPELKTLVHDIGLGTKQYWQAQMKEVVRLVAPTCCDVCNKKIDRFYCYTNRVECLNCISDVQDQDLQIIPHENFNGLYAIRDHTYRSDMRWLMNRVIQELPLRFGADGKPNWDRLCPYWRTTRIMRLLLASQR